MDVEYYKNLPKKRMAAGALILNDRDEILIVKPKYKDYWSIAGGVIEKDESPRSACIREVEEELGLSLNECKMLGVDYTTDVPEKGESLQFIFYGGKLSVEEIGKIQVNANELEEYKFVSIDEALLLLSDRLKKRLPKCLAALKDSRWLVYLENGV